MEIDLEHPGVHLQTLPRELRSQVCILGGGIAGLTLAHRLSGNGIRVTLLEAGGRTPETPDAADPFEADLRGEPHAGTRDGRVCALGGGSLTWGGQLLALPEDAGWPVSSSELKPFEAEAERLLGVDHLPDAASAFFAAIRATEPRLLQRLPALTPRLSKFVPFPKRNLAHTLGRQLRDSSRVHVLLHAHATELVLAPARDRIEGIVCRTAAGRQIQIQADQYVVAAGTVESCRLLLASNTVAPDGIGNACDQLGRNFHDHLTLTAASFTGRSRASLLQQMRPWVVRAGGGGRVLHSLKLEASAQMRERHGLNRAMAHLTFEEPGGSGVERLRTLLRSRQAGALSANLRATAWNLPKITLEALRLAWSARVQGRRYVSSQASVHLQLNVAQDAPSPSRILLGEERDARGMRKAVVDWAVTPEMQSLRGFAAYLRTQLNDAGFAEGAHWTSGLFTPDAPLRPSLDDARHAMGGACMGLDPRASVVDPHLRVHGVRNLSIASAAVFPDGAPQLPTLTLVALSLRLAARLQREFA